MYNETNITDANNILELTKAVNSLSGQLLGAFLLGTLFLIIFIVLKKREGDTKNCLLVSCFITTILAVILWGSEIISWKIVIYPIIGLIASIILVLASRG